MHRNQIILITGGSRSGKSRLAVQLAQLYSPKTFLATAELKDGEMAERASLHRKERGPEWITVEEPIAIGKILREVSDGVVILDCLTLWIANLLQQRLDIKKHTSEVLEILEDRRSNFLLVTNEVGSGIVPDNTLARNFRDLAGETNQQVARIADRVILMACGYPITLKER